MNTFPFYVYLICINSAYLGIGSWICESSGSPLAFSPFEQENTKLLSVISLSRYFKSTEYTLYPLVKGCIFQ